MPPTFTKSLKRVDGNIGNNASLDCKVSGSQPMTIAWFKDDQEITPGPKFLAEFRDHSATLQIAGLEKADSGVYKCRATNSAGLNRLIRVETQRQLQHLKVTGTPEIDIYWFKEGSEIHPSERYKMSFVNSVASLEVCGTDAKDSGLYYCEARNEWKIQLSVLKQLRCRSSFLRDVIDDPLCFAH
uniref:Ig-like domain-containing protein n=1 Tax=Takifugu rubripes TaxID=31033 RepID=A0A674NGA3_TAKRU